MKVDIETASGAYITIDPGQCISCDVIMRVDIGPSAKIVYGTYKDEFLVSGESLKTFLRALINDILTDADA